MCAKFLGVGFRNASIPFSVQLVDVSTDGRESFEAERKERVNK